MDADPSSADDSDQSNTNHIDDNNQNGETKSDNDKYDDTATPDYDPIV